jgi:hypothetical protein
MNHKIQCIFILTLYLNIYPTNISYFILQNFVRNWFRRQLSKKQYKKSNLSSLTVITRVSKNECNYCKNELNASHFHHNIITEHCKNDYATHTDVNQTFDQSETSIFYPLKLSWREAEPYLSSVFTLVNNVTSFNDHSLLTGSDKFL